MGYTHYFRQQRDATPAEWEAIARKFIHLQIAALLTEAFPIQREADDAGPVEITTEAIIFNGIAGDGHETMHLNRVGDGFQCCKTSRKPYDTAVMALLLLAHHHAPGCWNITSDGEIKDWKPTLDWMNSLGIGKFTIPFKDSNDLY